MGVQRQFSKRRSNLRNKSKSLRKKSRSRSLRNKSKSLRKRSRSRRNKRSRRQRGGEVPWCPVVRWDGVQRSPCKDEQGEVVPPPHEPCKTYPMSGESGKGYPKYFISTQIYISKTGLHVERNPDQWSLMSVFYMPDENYMYAIEEFNSYTEVLVTKLLNPTLYQVWDDLNLSFIEVYTDKPAKKFFSNFLINIDPTSLIKANHEEVSQWYKILE